MAGDICFLSFSSYKGDAEHRTLLDLQSTSVDLNKEIATRSKLPLRRP